MKDVFRINIRSVVQQELDHLLMASLCRKMQRSLRTVTSLKVNIDALGKDLLDLLSVPSQCCLVQRGCTDRRSIQQPEHEDDYTAEFFHPSTVELPAE